MDKPEPKDSRTATISVRVSPELKKRAEKRANDFERTLSSYIERLIELDLAKAGR